MTGCDGDAVGQDSRGGFPRFATSACLVWWWLSRPVAQVTFPIPPTSAVAMPTGTKDPEAFEGVPGYQQSVIKRPLFKACLPGR